MSALILMNKLQSPEKRSLVVLSKVKPKGGSSELVLVCLNLKRERAGVKTYHLVGIC